MEKAAECSRRQKVGVRRWHKTGKGRRTAESKMQQ